MEPTSEKLLVKLAEGDVRFVIADGIAVTLHGYVRQLDFLDLKRLTEGPKAFD